LEGVSAGARFASAVKSNSIVATKIEKKPKSYKAKEISNPASTGGAGVTFENRVQASRLLAMCLGHVIPGKTDGRVLELRFQSRVLGHHTDDLVCTFEDNSAARSNVLLQMKRTMHPREGDGAFSDAVGSAWLDFANSSVFKRYTDSIFLIYDASSLHSMGPAGTVSDWARSSADASEFLLKVGKAKFSNAANRNALAAIRSVASKFAERPITDDEAFEFIKHLNFYSQDLDRENTTEHVNYLKDIHTAGRIARQAVDAPGIWATLVQCCAGLNKDAATVTFDNLAGILGSGLNQLFATVRQASTLTLGSVTIPGTHREPEQDSVSLELARLAGLIEAMTRDQKSGISEDAAPLARDSSVNKLVSRQLDSINVRIKALRYKEAFTELVAFGEDQSDFDTHQRARWLLMRASCRWHLESAEAAADDFLAAAAICEDDDKLAAARVRGLLLKEDVAGAVKAGADAYARFPDSLAVWQIFANAQSLYGQPTTLEDIPVTHRDEADAIQVVAWSQHKHGNLQEALKIAVTSISKPTATFFTRNAALMIGLDVAADNALMSSFRLVGSDEKQALQRICEEFSPRGTKLWEVQSPETVSAVAHNLAYAYLLLGNPQEALSVVSEARSHSIDSAEMVRVELDALKSTKQESKALSRGIAELKRLSKEGIATFAQIAAEAGDLRAVEAAVEAASNLSPLESKLESMLVALRWEALSRSEHDRAVSEVQAKVFDDSSSIAELAIASRVLNKIDPAKSAYLIGLIGARLPTTEDSGERYLIAQATLYGKQWDVAANAYELILPKGQHSSIHNDLLYCYLRQGRRLDAKELIDTFPAGWEVDSDARSLAIQLGQQAGDWELLARLAPAQLKDFPNAAGSWLFKAMVAGRGIHGELAAAVAEFPEELSGQVREITQVASLEIRCGQKERGLRRLYSMRRANLDSIEAASAHLIAHVAITDDLPYMEETLEVVTEGCSVSLTSDGGTVTYTIDPVGMGSLPKTPEFVGPRSEVAKFLVGAKVGAEIVVDDSFGVSRIYVVTRIRSSFRRLLEHSQLAHQTSIVPSKYATSVPIGHDADGNADFSNLAKQLQRSKDYGDRIFNVYQSSPITLGGVSKMLGRNILDIVRGWRSEGPPLRVSGGNKAELQAAIDRLVDPAGSYVVDAATLAELATVGVLNALGTLPTVFVSSATRDLIEAQLEEVNVGRSEGTAYLLEGRLAFREFTSSDREREIAFLQSILAAIEAHCKVAPAYGTKEFAALGDKVRPAVSAEEHAVLLLATEKQATLLSVDERLRSFALGLFKIQGVWPQAFLASTHSKGAISDQEYSLAIVKWFFGNRTFISVTSQDLAIMAYQGTNWLRYGLTVVCKQFAQPDTEFDSAVRVSLGFLQQLASGPCHFGPVVHLLEYLSEALHRHKDCPKLFSANLAQEVQELLSNGSRVQNQLLVGAVKRGAGRAASAQVERPLSSVQVLMCSDPPWIAHLQEVRGQTVVGLEGVKSVAAPNLTLSDSSTLSNREDGDRLF
jgi:tetratricopeptide (TPR) repeat protein